MLRSMYAGISGMKGFQTKLDVVGNNIANVNTFGFKKGRVTFQDLMSQTVQGAQAPQVNDAGDPVLGGQNPMQVGLGVSTGSIDTIHDGGNTQTTNRTLDFALEGDGMFVVAKNTNPDSTHTFNDSAGNEVSTPGITLGDDGDNVNFTRAGNFYLDDDGYIVDANGNYLVGNPINGEGSSVTDDSTGKKAYSPIQIPEDAESFSIASDGTVNYVQDGSPQVAGQIQIAKFSNPEGLQKTGSNLFQLTQNAGIYDADNEGEDGYGVMDLLSPGDQGSATIRSGALEMSNVDLSEEFTEMITAQRGFQANTRIITTSDEILQELVNLKR
ncbi:flagellar hook protein FlgE [Salinibacillus kushneri]|uniref:Flagellar hook protein FlgE n=1 Tax=Salinibacillus kushneri TaxID=237682 RepID=A0A1I0E8T8_9BACI|nr:flagellar basal body rod protein FlgG [Salinibacillus kushneri]SET41645.1 flagellar hook protein FlgE [Salinibacillus kushneri]